MAAAATASLRISPLLQAAVLVCGGDLFLLDMGEPVRILEMAKQMARLSGLSLRDAQHPQADIEIVCTGLGAGEKLYEELLIDAESQPTTHPLIYRATERAILPGQLWSRVSIFCGSSTPMPRPIGRPCAPSSLSGQVARLWHPESCVSA